MTRFIFCLVVFVLVFCAPPVRAHSGPPFPIVSNRTLGAYDVSVWTDPDTTDDGVAGGQFWIVLKAAGGAAVPQGTQVDVSIAPLERAGATHSGRASPVNGAIDNQFVALLMDHEGPFRVQVVVDGPLGRVELESRVDATYDLRPSPAMVVLYALPFLVLGGLWMKLLMRKRSGSR